MKTTWKKDNIRFDREKTVFNNDRVQVSFKDGSDYFHLTTITPEEMKKKKLDFYLDSDIEKFKRIYR